MLSRMRPTVHGPRPPAEDARIALTPARANVVYGAVRLIEKDDESFLAWAREPWALEYVVPP